MRYTIPEEGFSPGLHISVDARVEEILAEFNFVESERGRREALRGLARTLAHTEEALRRAERRVQRA